MRLRPLLSSRGPRITRLVSAGKWPYSPVKSKDGPAIRLLRSPVKLPSAASAPYAQSSGRAASDNHGSLIRSVTVADSAGLALYVVPCVDAAVCNNIDEVHRSATTKQQLGLSAGVQLRAKFECGLDDALAGAVEPATIARELERYCEITDEHGIRCCLSLLEHLRRRFPAVKAMRLSTTPVSFTPSWKFERRQSPNSSLKLMPGDFDPSLTRPYLRVYIRNLPRKRMTLADDTTSSSTSHTVYVDLCGGPELEHGLATVSRREIGVDEYVRHIAETANTVIARLSKGMIFAQRTSVPVLFSEAVLRSLRAEGFIGEVVRVGFVLEQSAPDQPQITGETLWRDGEATSGEPVLPFAPTATDSDWWIQHAMGRLNHTEFAAALAQANGGWLLGKPERGVCLVTNGEVTIHAMAKLR